MFAPMRAHCNLFLISSGISMALTVGYVTTITRPGEDCFIGEAEKSGKTDT